MLEWMFALGQLIDYINANAINNPSLEQMSSRIGYSTFYCSEKFHTMTGMTIRQYLARRKIFAAQKMLTNTDKTITEIALNCGFSSQQAFTRSFSKLYGITPAVYRKHPAQILSMIQKESELFMETRGVFDTIAEDFERYRPRYSDELFEDLIRYGGIGPGKCVLELGPGTGQATDPILNTGCEYQGIELGKHLAAKMREKYGRSENFQIIHDDFATHDFGEMKYDMIYSARTIQWIPQEVAFGKTFDLLKPGGILAMINLSSDYKSPNPELFENIQKVYSQHYRPVTQYRHRNFPYHSAVDYGYVDYERREYYGTRMLTAEQYIRMVSTHSDHITIPEPHRTPFFNGLRKAVLDAGDLIEYRDTHILMLAKKPG